MPWFIFAFLTALFESAKDLISKRNAKDIHSYILCLGFSFFALPVVGIGAIFETGTIFNVNVLALSVVAGVLYASSVLLFMTALKHSDLSLSLPLLSISPVFLLILSPIMIGEVPRARGLYGVLFVIAGSY
ncbi:MAG: EamA family transporter, partial [Bdellovibrionales bacterium]|nr:EamA family transporter [Bdellovibrionales bacterium]